MSTLSFLLGLFFATFNTTTVPAANINGGFRTETTTTTTSKDGADFIIGDDLNNRKP